MAHEILVDLFKSRPALAAEIRGAPRPELGALSAMAHGEGEQGTTIAAAVLPAVARLRALVALAPALRARRPAPGLVHHSDRGSLYASDDYRRVLRSHGLIPSMSRAGDCWDNATQDTLPTGGPTLPDGT